MHKIGKSEDIIQNVVGCGKFQVILSICVYFLANNSPLFTMMFMSFGNYNPGWKCSQQTSSSMADIHSSNTSIGHTQTVNTETSPTITKTSSRDQLMQRCDVFKSCDHIEFDPRSSTIISEWELVCDRSWISSFIISIQMVGILVGSLFAGYIGDAIGRKMSIYGALFILTCLNLMSIFSSSWEMFAVLRFFLGLSCSFVLSLYYVFTAEFVPNKWRSILLGTPAGNISTTLFALTCMYLKDWRYIHGVMVVLGIIALIPAVWIPESLRWLEAKNKTKEFNAVAEKIARTNGKPLPFLDDYLDQFVSQEIDGGGIEKAKRYNVSHLFKTPVKKYTIYLTLPWLFVSLSKFAVGFGIKALHGNFYLNLIISNSIAIPFTILSMTLPNLLGRKPSALIISGLTGACFCAASFLDYFSQSALSDRVAVVLILTSQGAVGILWDVLAVITMEVYPTVIRGMGVSWSLVIVNTGAIMAPLLIPEDHGRVVIPYIILGVMSALCLVFLSKLPETKGKPLVEKFESDDEDDGL